MSDEELFIDVSFAQDGGVLKKILKEAPEGASGPPPKGTQVEAHYTGTLGFVSYVRISHTYAYVDMKTRYS